MSANNTTATLFHIHTHTYDVLISFSLYSGAAVAAAAAVGFHFHNPFRVHARSVEYFAGAHSTSHCLFVRFSACLHCIDSMVVVVAIHGIYHISSLFADID